MTTYTKLLQLSIKKQTSKFKAYITWHLYSCMILRYMWYAIEFKFFFQIFFLLFSFRTASGGAQGAAANGAVEGQKPSGPPSVRHITIGPMSFWRSIFVCISLNFHEIRRKMRFSVDHLRYFGLYLVPSNDCFCLSLLARETKIYQAIGQKDVKTKRSQTP